MEYASYIVVPLIITLAGLAFMRPSKGLFSEFLEGAREGLNSGVKLLPTLVALVTAVSMFNASGAADFIAGLLAGPLGAIGIPAEITPLLIVRPVSGGASTALLNGIFTALGADSFAGRCASVIAGSSDTIIYITALYFGSAGIKKTRHTLPAAFLTMIFAVFISCLAVRVFFG